MKKLTPFFLFLLLAACGGSTEAPQAISETPPAAAPSQPEAATPALSMAELLAGMPEEPMPENPETLTRARKDGESIAGKEAPEKKDVVVKPAVEPTPTPAPQPTATEKKSAAAPPDAAAETATAKTEATKPSSASEPPRPAANPALSSTLSVESASVAKQVVDRQPSGQGPFSDGGTVWTWNRILNPEGKKRTIRHVYYRDGQRVVAVPLAINGASWRTWSRTAVHGSGAWRVDIVDENDRLLKSIPFVVQ